MGPALQTFFTSLLILTQFTFQKNQCHLSTTIKYQNTYDNVRRIFVARMEILKDFQTQMTSQKF